MTTIKRARAKVFKNDGKQRAGRGFSREELKKAGSSLKEALRLGVPVDDKRKTVHEENVDAVRALLQERKPASEPEAPRGKPKG
jgi:ribosomal protein L13E